MSQNKAIKVIAPGDAQIVDTEIPKLPADYILVKTSAVSINPTDWKHIDTADKQPCIGAQVGCDYSGVVVEVGPEVTKDFKKGDRVCGVVNGCNAEMRDYDGSFANYIVAKGDLQIKTPDNLSDEEAATLGIAVSTVGQGLYKNLKLPFPTEPSTEGKFIFIYGGSTAMGISGIQYAKASGYKVLTTASSHNVDYLKSLGAEAVFDYKSPTIVDDIRAYAGDNIELAWDCQSDEASTRISAGVLSKAKGGKIGNLLPVDHAVAKAVNDKVAVEMTLAYNIFNETYGFFGQKPAPQPEEYEFAKKFWEMSRGLFAEGKVKPIKVDVNRGGKGLEGVKVGLQEMREGKVSACKLVYTL